MAITVKQKKSSEAIEIDVKRLYLPGIVLSSKCHNCKKTVKYDLGEQYLSYPSANVPIDHTMYCSDCSCEWTEEIILRITVEPAETR